MNWKREELKTAGYETVVYAEEKDSGLKAIIAIHDTTLGPACGGIRMIPFASREDALYDVLRLARGMSYKSSLAGIGFGGGKSVIIGDPKKKTTALFHAMGAFIETLGGRYYGAKDMNMTTEDLLETRKHTKYILGMEGVRGSSGDPSPVTARGLFAALRATVEEVRGSESMRGLKVAVQGIGTVGYPYAQKVRAEGGELWVTDVDNEALKRAERELGAHVVGLDVIYGLECDIFSPCARGAILNPETLPKLRCQAIVGCANNQLKDDSIGQELHRRRILYAPDFAANAGGIINIFYELGGAYDAKAALVKADEIHGTMKEIFRRSRTKGVPPFVVADELAEERIRAAR